MWQPLLSPSPVLVFAGYRKAEIECDSIFIAEACRNSIHDSAGRARVFVGLEKHVWGVAVAAAHQHGCVIRIAAENPMKLVPRIQTQLRLEFRLVRKQR